MGTVNIVYEEKIANSYIQECVESLPSMEQTTKGVVPWGRNVKIFTQKCVLTQLKKVNAFLKTVDLLISKELKDNHQA